MDWVVRQSGILLKYLKKLSLSPRLMKLKITSFFYNSNGCQCKANTNMAACAGNADKCEEWVFFVYAFGNLSHQRC